MISTKKNINIDNNIFPDW